MQMWRWKKKVSPQHSASSWLHHPFYSAMRGGHFSAIYWRVMRERRFAYGWRATTCGAAGTLGSARHFRPGGNRHEHALLFRLPTLSRFYVLPVRRYVSAPVSRKIAQSILKRLQNQSARWQHLPRGGAGAARIQQAFFHLMRSGRPCPVLVDLPFDVRAAETNRSGYAGEPPVYKPAASRVQIEKALEMLIQPERPVIAAGGGLLTPTPRHCCSSLPN